MTEECEHQSDPDPAPTRHADAERVSSERAEHPAKDESARAQEAAQDRQTEER